MPLKRRHVLLAGIAAFIAWGNAVIWVPALRWVGYAFVAGIIVTAVAVIAAIVLPARIPTSRSPRPPGPKFLAPSRWKTELAALEHRQQYTRVPLVPEAPKVSKAVDDVLELILAEFVRSWYSHISPNPTFADEVEKAIRTALSNLCDTLRGKDLAEILTSRIVPILTTHFHDFAEAERAIRGRKLNRSMTESEELDLAVASKYREGRLHEAASLSFADTKMIQQDYLRTVTTKLLPDVLPEYMLSSRAVSVIITELVGCVVLFPVLQLLSDPDTWNQLMENLGRSMLQDRSTVRKLRAALDQHAQPSPRTSKLGAIPRFGPGDNARKYEKFLRGIEKINNLSDARRLRSEVASQLKRDSQQENPDQVYLRRLEVGKRWLDQKVNRLAAGGDRHSAAGPGPATPAPKVSWLEHAPLVELLRDPSGLSYFMEYMDRQKLMSLVQFWLVVDGFRNPLEDDGQDEEEVPPTLAPWTESDRLDLQQIHQAYLSKPELNVPDASKKEVRDFLQAGKSATQAQYYKARSAILRAQSAVLQEMKDRFYQNFKRSDLFYKCLASQEASHNKPIASNNASGPSAAPPMSRASSSFQGGLKQASRLTVPGARDAPSTSDLKSLNVNGSGGDVFMGGGRRSFDDSSHNPLFDDDVQDEDGMVDSIQSLPEMNGSGHGHHHPDKQVVKAVEEALTNILEGDRPQTAEDLRASLFGGPAMAELGGPSPISNDDNDSKRGSVDSGRSLFGLVKETRDQDKPSLSSLGLVSAASRIGVFVDDDLFGDEDKNLADERDVANDDDAPEDDGDVVHEAAPGDLGLAEAITALTNDLDRLAAQEAVVDSLTRKAELTNNTAELRILKKSKGSLLKEIRHKELQRQQYVIQESDNSLYGRSTIRIKNIQLGKEDDGREFALYVVEVQRNAGEQMPAATWTVTRRYSEFHELHQKLRSSYPSVRNLDFPRRRVVMKFQSEFLRKRRTGLEKYLRELLLLPEVCRSRELRAFLSQNEIALGEDVMDHQDKKDIVSRLYDSVTYGVEDILGNIPVLDQLSVAGQSLIAAATSQMNAMPGNTGEEVFPAAEAEAELNAFENKELEPFIKPICDIFLEVFELNRGNNWLRGRAAVVVLQQLLGGTIERKVRDTVGMMVSEDSILKYVDMITGILWPGGKWDRNRKPRTEGERKKTRTEASLMLATLVPDLAGSVVGRANAQAASRRLFATFNNPRLNAHLVFTILDEIIPILFEEA